jgi:hypothetical protein
MIRLRVLAAALLCLPLPAGAQAVQWKAIACIVETPDFMRGVVLKFYFSDSGKVHIKGIEYPATITPAEISFCFSLSNGQTCYTISRITGRFSAIALGVMSGTCTSEGQHPNF